jgi:hypothetical protein
MRYGCLAVSKITEEGGVGFPSFFIAADKISMNEGDIWQLFVPLIVTIMGESLPPVG